jgi:hypothetical protein
VKPEPKHDAAPASDLKVTSMLGTQGKKYLSLKFLDCCVLLRLAYEKWGKLCMIAVF